MKKGLILKYYECNIYVRTNESNIMIIAHSIKDAVNFVKELNSKYGLKIKVKRKTCLQLGSYYNKFKSYEECMRQQFIKFEEAFKSNKIYVK